LKFFPEVELRHAKRTRIKASYLFVAVLIVIGASGASAHVPHDVVTDIAPSPAFTRDGTIFAIVRNNLLRTTDAGASWHRLTRGLDSTARIPDAFHPTFETDQSTITTIRLSPAFESDQTAFVGLKSGTYISRNRGLNWKRVSRGLPNQQISLLAISPQFAKRPILLAVTSKGEVFRTVDAGNHWSRVQPAGSGFTTLHWAPGMLLAGSANGRLSRSTDSGRTWHLYGELPGKPRIRTIESRTGRAASGPLLVGTDTGLFRFTPGGRAEKVTAGLPDEPITSLSFMNAGEGRSALLMTTFRNGVFRSDDAGDTWKKFDDGVKTALQADHVGAPQFTRIVVSEDGAAVLGGYAGVFLSEDLGNSWKKLLTLPGGIIVSLDLSPATDDGYAIALATYGGGIYSKNVHDPTWRANNRGLRLQPQGGEGFFWRMGTVAFSPEFDQDHSLFTATFDFVAKSSDAGANWNEVPVEFARHDGPFPGCPDGKADRAAYPYNFQFVYDFAFSPGYAKDRTIFASFRPEGLLRSVDGGASFSKFWHGCGSQVWSVVVSPHFTGDKTLFASLSNGIHRSSDGGLSWQRVAPGRQYRQTHLTISPQFKTDRTVYASGPFGLWRSLDAGDTWHQLQIAGKNRPIARGGVAISPFAAEHRELFVQTTGGRLYRCRDEGSRFTATPLDAPTEFSQMRQFRDRAPLIAFSPNYPSDGTLYAASMHRLFASTDRGLTWSEVPIDITTTADPP
jgi:photosystem II stability/assembly factor-like uncharacterized protein